MKIIKTQVRLPKDVYDALVHLAQKDSRSMNGEIVMAIREWCAERIANDSLPVKSKL